MKGKTSSGFEYEIEDAALDDWLFFKTLRKIDMGEEQCVVDLLPLLLKNGQDEQLENHLLKIEGKIKLSSMLREISDILESNKDLKN